MQFATRWRQASSNSHGYFSYPHWHTLGGIRRNRYGHTFWCALLCRLVWHRCGMYRLGLLHLSGFLGDASSMDWRSCSSGFSGYLHLFRRAWSQNYARRPSRRACWSGLSHRAWGTSTRSGEPSYALRYRLDSAVHYLKQNPSTRCVVSGGQGANEPCSEAACMHAFLTQQGIAFSRILDESTSTTTVENLRFSMQTILEQTSEQRPRLPLSRFLFRHRDK